MPAGTMILMIAAVFAYCGILERILCALYLTRQQALLLIGCMFAGTLLPNISFGNVQVNIGGGLIPLGVCAYVMFNADEPRELWHAAIGTVLTAVAVYALSVFMPSEAEQLPIDPMWLYAAFGGVIAWLIGRSHRCAFVCSVCGIIMADLVSGIVSLLTGYEMVILLGGGGIADAAVVSGVFAVLISDSFGWITGILERGRIGDGGR